VAGAAGTSSAESACMSLVRRRSASAGSFPTSIRWFLWRTQ
jgi:hypothetical protein